MAQELYNLELRFCELIIYAVNFHVPLLCTKKLLTGKGEGDGICEFEGDGLFSLVDESAAFRVS